MIFVRVWNYFVGYVVIRVEGLSLEKFINLAISKGILLWGIKRIHYTAFTASVSIAGFRRLHSVTRKVRCHVRIQEKRGFPFVVHRYQHRKMLLIGMFMFVVLLYGFSSFIWTVDVEGLETVSPQRIVDELATLGVRPGMYKRGINILAIENKMRTNIPEVSWFSLEIRGARAIARIAEAVLPPTMVDKSIPANIVAKKDGIIHDMIVLEGEAVIKIGQTVQEGQLLVSGVIDHPNTIGTRYVHAMGQIMARTWYEGSVRLLLKEPLRERTGAKVELRYMELGNLKIFYQQEEIPFIHYDLVLREEPFFPKGQFLPVQVVVEEYYEVIEIQLDKDSEAVKKRMENLAWEDARKKVPAGAKVIDKKLKYDIIEGEEILAVLYVEALEDIGLKKQILVDQTE